MKDEYFIPPMIGGTGDLYALESKFPIYEGPKGMKYYYLCTMGFHLYSMWIHFVQKARNDFIEMGLHHGATLFLYGVSYYLARYECGLIIMYLHDLADIPSAFLRCWSETLWSRTALFWGIAMITAWPYTRLYCYPYIWHKVLTVEVYNGKYPIVATFCGVFLLAL